MFLLSLLNSLVKADCKKDIAYIADGMAKHQLDIYMPKNAKGKKLPVLVFVHGGSWNSGDKSTYSFIGKRAAAKGMIGVIINYRLIKDLEGMQDDCAKALLWVKENIDQFGGDSEKIIAMGHSAGAYNLAALINYQYFEKKTASVAPFKTMILNDPFGPDMHWYLKNYHDDESKSFYALFGSTEKEWKEKSPVFHPVKTNKRIVVYQGQHTYGSVQNSANEYYFSMMNAGNEVHLKMFRGKKHAGMVIQLFFPWNKMWKEIQSEFARINSK